MRALLVLALPFGLAVAGDLTEQQKKELKEVRPLLAGPIDVDAAKAVERTLPGFGTKDLLDLERQPELKELSERDQRRLLRAVHTIAFAKEHEKDLADPWPAAVFLGSPDWRDWLVGIRLLQREKLGDGLERVAVELSHDPRPQVRAGAGRLAKILTRLRGPSPACTEIAKRLLADECPNVVMMFGVYDAHDFRDKEVMDVVIACLRDRRALDPVPGLTPWGTDLTVTWSITSRLRGEICRSNLLERGTWRVIREWWKRNRARYDYGLSPDRWQFLGEWKGTCRKKEEVAFVLPEGRFHFAVLDYKEHWLGDRPVNDLTMSFWCEGEDPAKCGSTCSKLREDGEKGFYSLGMFTQRWMFEHFVVPDRHGAFRVALRVWKAK